MLVDTALRLPLEPDELQTEARMKKPKLIALIIELVGISIASIGIGLEVAAGGQPYLVMITTGSVVIATGSIIWGKFIRAGK